MDNADSDQSGLVPEYRVPILASSPEAPDGPAGGRDWSDAARPVKVRTVYAPRAAGRRLRRPRAGLLVPLLVSALRASHA